MRRKAARELILAGVAAALGCGGGGGAPSADLTSSTTKATVSGTVTVKGKPIKKGSVIFNPANAQRKDVAPVEVPIDAEGKYQVETLVGTNQVKVKTSEGGAAAGSGYQNFYEVKEGANAHDIEIAR